MSPLFVRKPYEKLRHSFRLDRPRRQWHFLVSTKSRGAPARRAAYGGRDGLDRARDDCRGDRARFRAAAGRGEPPARCGQRGRPDNRTVAARSGDLTCRVTTAAGAVLDRQIWACDRRRLPMSVQNVLVPIVRLTARLVGWL